PSLLCQPMLASGLITSLKGSINEISISSSFGNAELTPTGVVADQTVAMAEGSNDSNHDISHTLNSSNSRFMPEMPFIVNEKMASEKFINRMALSAVTADNVGLFDGRNARQSGIAPLSAPMPEPAAQSQAPLLIDSGLTWQYPVSKSAEPLPARLKSLERDLKEIKVISFTGETPEPEELDTDKATLRSFPLDDRLRFAGLKSSPLSAENSVAKSANQNVGKIERAFGSKENLESIPQTQASDKEEISNKIASETDINADAAEPVLQNGKMIEGKEVASDGRINHRLQQTEKLDIQSVRFTAPLESDIRELKSGRTVIIKMEPEHLGPVRLTLSTSGDSLHGRMTVQSMEARTAVEGNLNELQEQLSRQGIKLDSFQISLAGGQVGQRAFGGRRSPTESGGMSRNNSRDLSNPISGLIEKTLSQRLYISATGVNWVA
ncbi:MAG: flagellar hook-length control protein FliK, partial [Candidatus Zixiibacteriota bacterium]